jgi:hypothetical protein
MQETAQRAGAREAGQRKRWGRVLGAAIVCLGAAGTFAQSVPAAPAPVLTMQLPLAAAPEDTPPFNKRAAALYRRGADALRKGKNACAERDAQHAARLAPGFADAWALAATASLARRDFGAAEQQAATAVRLDPGMQTGWILLATARNHSGQYAAAQRALDHVEFAGEEPWQADYQRARAAAGLGEGPEVLAFSNRAALTAPAGFAPLHLLRASALAGQKQYRDAAEELALYLGLTGARSPEHAVLQQEAAQLQAMARTASGKPTR